jgi:hypothetical protein
LTSTLVEDVRSVSCPCNFTPGERVLGIHWIIGSMGSGVGLDPVGKKQFLVLLELEL